MREPIISMELTYLEMPQNMTYVDMPMNSHCVKILLADKLSLPLHSSQIMLELETITYP